MGGRLGKSTSVSTRREIRGDKLDKIIMLLVQNLDSTVVRLPELDEGEPA